MLNESQEQFLKSWITKSPERGEACQVTVISLRSDRSLQVSDGVAGIRRVISTGCLQTRHTWSCQKQESEYQWVEQNSESIDWHASQCSRGDHVQEYRTCDRLE